MTGKGPPDDAVPDDARTGGDGRPDPVDPGAWGAGAALALSMFSVAPVRASRTDRPAAARAITLAPLVGLVLGGIVAGVVVGLLALGAPALLAGVAGVATGAALTRGLHLDGLADLADGLGAHGSPERMRAVMKDPSTGAFGVLSLVLAVGAQAAALPAVAARGPGGVLAVVVAWAAGRAAFGWAARRGVPAASSGGLGALVAATQPPAVPLVWTTLLAAAAVVAVPGRPWQGPVAVVVGTLVAGAATRHAVRRAGGVTGDVFGAVGEITVTVVLAGLALNP